MNFHYAAFTYLYEWVCYDRYFMKVLAWTRDPQPKSEQACKELVAVATHYNVIRNFKAEGDETDRLLPVWNALRATSVPVSQEEAQDRVKAFVEDLKPQYCHELISAASKILWFRFQSPIVIFDSLAMEALTERTGPIHAGYGGFYNCWQAEFSEQEDEIRTVCGKLSGLSGLIEFLDDCSQEALEEAISNRWFRERVFDHALMNYALERRSKADQSHNVSRWKAVS